MKLLKTPEPIIIGQDEILMQLISDREIRYANAKKWSAISDFLFIIYTAITAIQLYLYNTENEIVLNWNQYFSILFLVYTPSVYLVIDITIKHKKIYIAKNNVYYDANRFHLKNKTL